MDTLWSEDVFGYEAVEPSDQVVEGYYDLVDVESSSPRSFILAVTYAVVTTLACSLQMPSNVEAGIAFRTSHSEAPASDFVSEARSLADDGFETWMKQLPEDDWTGALDEDSFVPMVWQGGRFVDVG